MPSRDPGQALRKMLPDLTTKGDEARINENLASICRALDNFLPRIKASVEHGAALTDEETERIRQLNDAYNANIERYKRLKGFK